MKFKGLPKDCYGKANRLRVDAFNKMEHCENIYAIGDTCIQTTDPNFPDGHPQLGSVAQQQGKALADNFVTMTKNKNLKPFRYIDKGTMAIIGDQKAVADMTFPKITLTGWLAWFSWLFVHLFLLVSYRNRFRTFWNWFNAYLGKGQSQGIMIGKFPKGAPMSNKFEE